MGDLRASLAPRIPGLGFSWPGRSFGDSLPRGTSKDRGDRAWLGTPALGCVAVTRNCPLHSSCPWPHPGHPTPRCRSLLVASASVSLTPSRWDRRGLAPWGQLSPHPAGPGADAAARHPHTHEPATWGASPRGAQGRSEPGAQDLLCGTAPARQQHGPRGEHLCGMMPGREKNEDFLCS